MKVSLALSKEIAYLSNRLAQEIEVLTRRLGKYQLTLNPSQRDLEDKEKHLQLLARLRRLLTTLCTYDLLAALEHILSITQELEESKECNQGIMFISRNSEGFSDQGSWTFTPHIFSRKAN